MQHSRSTEAVKQHEEDIGNRLLGTSTFDARLSNSLSPLSSTDALSSALRAASRRDTGRQESQQPGQTQCSIDRYFVQHLIWHTDVLVQHAHKLQRRTALTWGSKEAFESCAAAMELNTGPIPCWDLEAVLLGPSSSG